MFLYIPSVANKARDKQTELSQLKDNFIATVTHELRTPLTSIRALSELLHRDPRMRLEQRSKFLGLIVKESERLTGLIDQVLDVANLDAGNAEWQTCEFDPREPVEDAVNVAKLHLDERKKVTLTIDAPESVPLICADRMRFTQVLLHLISNAAKFCNKTDGRVRIALSEEPNVLRIDVTDNGEGISPEDQALIFERFRQVSESNTGKPQGMGLGLFMSRKIVNYFGGTLWVQSTLGQGSTFSFTVPIPDIHPGTPIA